MTTPSPESKSTTTTTSTTDNDFFFVKSMWKFTGEYDNELSFEVGIVIRVLEKPHAEWWRGMTSDGNVGLFPNNHTTQVKSKKDGDRVAVLYDFVGHSDMDLKQLTKGETLTVLEQEHTGWWLGEKSSGELGMFPSNYVKVLPKNYQSPKPPPLPSRNASKRIIQPSSTLASTTPAVTGDTVSSSPPSIPTVDDISSTDAQIAKNSTNNESSSSSSSESSCSSSTATAAAEEAESPVSEVDVSVIHDTKAFDTLLEEGLVVEPTREGETGAPKLLPGQFVSIHCRAMTWDGASFTKRQFSSTIKSSSAAAQPIGASTVECGRVDTSMRFKLTEGVVTKGLFEGLQKLSVGQTATITCEPARAYGDAGMPPHVPPNSYIIYEVEVCSAKEGREDEKDCDEMIGGGPEELFRSSLALRNSQVGFFKGRPASVILEEDPLQDQEGEEAGESGGLDVSDGMIAKAASEMGLGAAPDEDQ